MRLNGPGAGGSAGAKAAAPAAPAPAPSAPSSAYVPPPWSGLGEHPYALEVSILGGVAVGDAAGIADLISGGWGGADRSSKTGRWWYAPSHTRPPIQLWQLCRPR